MVLGSRAGVGSETHTPRGGTAPASSANALPVSLPLHSCPEAQGRTLVAGLSESTPRTNKQIEEKGCAAIV